MLRPGATVLAALIAALVAVLAAGPLVVPVVAGAAGPPTRIGAVDAPLAYRPPVDAPVVDGFRLPAGPYGPGNRGLEYATTPGIAVTAVERGRVVFAGPVAGTPAVTVLHPDGLRSSYSPLRRVAVDRDDQVARGQVLGTAGPRLHLGIRSGDAYLDPSTLFSLGTTAHLVPVHSAADPTPVGP